MERLVKTLKSEGKHNFPSFYDDDGLQLYAAVLETLIHPILRHMQRYISHKDEIYKDLQVEY